MDACIKRKFDESFHLVDEEVWRRSIVEAEKFIEQVKEAYDKKYFGFILKMKKHVDILFDI